MGIQLYQKALVASEGDECQISLHGERITGILIVVENDGLQLLSCSHIKYETQQPTIKTQLDLLNVLNLPITSGTTFDLSVLDTSGDTNEYTVIIITE